MTQPSAPDIQAPSHAISASGGACTPCTRAYARGGFPAGKRRGRCVVRYFARVCTLPKIEQMSGSNGHAESVVTHRLPVWAARGPVEQARPGGIFGQAHYVRCMHRRGLGLRWTLDQQTAAVCALTWRTTRAGATPVVWGRSSASPSTRRASTHRSCLEIGDQDSAGD